MLIPDSFHTPAVESLSLYRKRSIECDWWELVLLLPLLPPPTTTGHSHHNTLVNRILPGCPSHAQVTPASTITQCVIFSPDEHQSPFLSTAAQKDATKEDTPSICYRSSLYCSWNLNMAAQLTMTDVWAR